MRVIIAGSRSITDMAQLQQAIFDSGYDITEVVCGKARGVDSLGDVWAQGHHIPVKYFPANWEKFGKSAGYRRNEEMAHYADAAIVVWDGSSKGSGHMVDIMKRVNKPCFQRVVGAHP